MHLTPLNAITSNASPTTMPMVFTTYIMASLRRFWLPPTPLLGNAAPKQDVTIDTFW
jgi:hypothetical protein